MKSNKISKIFILLSVLLSTHDIYSQISIEEARALAEGTEVTVQGIVTNGSELGIIRYIQDSTAGLAIYPGTGSVGSFPEDVQRGDEISVRGTLKVYNELLEVDPVMEYTILSSGNALPAPKEIGAAEIGEDLEGQLVVIDNVEFLNGGSVFGVGNYSFSADGEESEIYIRSNHPLLGSDIPLARVRMTGIVSQFNSIYQVLPRDANDIIILDNFFIDGAPEQTELSSTGFTIEWSTNAPGNSILRYGTDENLGEELVVSDLVSDHKVELTGLEPGEFYYVQAASDNTMSEVAAPVQLYSTASNSSGEIRIYFNHEVDGNFSTGSYANAFTSAEVERAIIDFIDNAEVSIDIAMYNTNRRTIVEALTRAHERGIVVRMIADNETANLALSNPTPPFNILRGNSEGLMHNKFLVIDGDNNDSSWLLCGSMNLTEQNMANDYNNMLAIQDVALCKSYTLEFEEMWGSEGDFPGIFNVRFGPNKVDNTPHLFSVGGIMFESYFSPSDNTTAEIAEEIDNAEESLNFALLTFTNNTLGSAVLNAYQRGTEVRGIIDNINDTGSEYNFLTGNGVNVTQDFTSTQTHHKYCIIDAVEPNSDPVVVTGSHNWSASAEDRNDENTLIIHDATISNIFLQEFEARWCEAAGGSNCTSALIEGNFEEEQNIELYPSPASSVLFLKLEKPQSRNLVKIYDATGRLVQARVFPKNYGQSRLELDVHDLNTGHYYIILEQDGNIFRKQFSKF